MDSTRKNKGRSKQKRAIVTGLITICVIALLGAGTIFWLGSKAATINRNLGAADDLVALLKENLSSNDTSAASTTVGKIREHTSLARDAAGDPIWTLTSTLPWVGPNLTAVSEVARSADDVANLGLLPLTKAFASLNWNELVPDGSPTDLAPLRSASPSITSAAHAVSASADRLDTIETSNLLPQISEPLISARRQLREVTETLNAAAVASQILPGMMGGDAPRDYLLIIQNNAEARSSGGIPGALAVLSVDRGVLSLKSQGSASDLGSFTPPVAVDPEQQTIYSARLGKYLQDVNLTPDFPTAASTAQAMWSQRTGHEVSGVISIDPVALSYVLDAIGPVKLRNPELVALANGTLPTELTGKNLVPTLLSDVYSHIPQPKRQDAYFAGVAQEVFSTLSSNKSDPKRLIDGITRGVEEGRVLLWSSDSQEQTQIARYQLSGSVSGPSVSPAQFGIFFNDATGAKMDYYIKRTVKIVKECPKNGYNQVTLRVTSSNTAPADAAKSLPPYVTGDGIYGVPAGSVQTNIVAYGPIQSVVESAQLDGEKAGFAPYFHSNRPVGVLAVVLAPGETRTVDFTFGRIVQHAEPQLQVTPTVQAVKDVTLPTEDLQCG